MTREELEQYTDQITEWTRYQSQPIHLILLQLRKHDQQQRGEIARLTKEKDKWAELAGSFTQSQHQYLKDMELLKKELARLRAALKGFTDAFELDFVVDGQIVDCPEKMWSPIIGLYQQAHAALKEGA